MRHGTPYAYDQCKCRCRECRSGVAERRRRARLRAKGWPYHETECPWCGVEFDSVFGAAVHAGRWCEFRPAVVA